MECPNCQSPNPESARFCNNCGTSLEQLRPIKGERRLVTVLFADVVGSTAMAEQLDPEQVTEIMNGAFAFMNNAVGRYDGTVARLMGDAIMAFFGAPVAHENDPERAIRAGMEMRDAATVYAIAVRSRYGLEFNIRVGINTGLVVIATVGDELRSEYTVMGDTVNVAARLQQVADPGSVLISADTHRLAAHLLHVEPRGPIQLKGKSEPVDTYEVVGLATTHTQGRGLAGITSPLVGRSRELDRLRERLHLLRDGQGGTVSIIGEAGLGKSRLVAEFKKVANDPSLGISWLEGRALSHGQAIPYLPWRELFRQALAVDGRDDPSVVREKLGGFVAELGRSDETQRYLETLIGVERDGNPVSSDLDDGDESRRRLRRAVRESVAAMAERSPLIVVLDDLHWADAGSFDLLREVADISNSHAVLIIMILRPDKDSPGWSFVESAAQQYGEGYVQIWLEPLDSEHSGELLGNLLHIEDLPTSIRDMILSRADGNPFFLEEVIRTLIDSGHIVRHNGHWRATSDIVNVTVPDTLVGVLSARIDRLPDETRLVAQIAATIGRIFTYPVLKAVCQSAPGPERIEDPAPHLETLSLEGLVRERASRPELEYIFKHVLTQEAAYNLLLVRTRREYHRRTAAVLESLYTDSGRQDEQAATLAHHYWHGEDWQRAAAYSLTAGSRAESRLYAMHEAHEHFERAFQALQNIQEPPRVQIVEAVLAGTNTALKFLPQDEVLTRLDLAERMSRELGDKRSLSQVLHWVAHIYVLRGITSRAMPALMENYQLADELDDQRLRLYPSWAMAFTMLNVDPRTAAETLTDIAAQAETYRNRHLEMHGLGGAAVGYARLGEFDKAQLLLERAKAVADRTDEPITVADYHLLASFAYLDMGEHELSLEHARLGLDKSLESDLLECVGVGFCLIGRGNLQRRNADEALTTFRDSLQYAEGFRGDVQIVNEVEAGMAVARYTAGETDSLEEIERAKTNSESLGDKYTVAETSLVLADAFLKKGDYSSASDHLSLATDFYRSTGMRPHLARALEIEARIAEVSGELQRESDLRAEREVIELELRQFAARRVQEAIGDATSVLHTPDA